MTSCEYSPAGTVFDHMQKMGIKYQTLPPFHLLNLDIKCTRLRICGSFRRSENCIMCSGQEYPVAQKNHRHDPCNICASTLPSGKRYRCLRALTSRLKNSYFPEAVQSYSATLLQTACFICTVFCFERIWLTFFCLSANPINRPKHDVTYSSVQYISIVVQILLKPHQ